MAAELFAGDTSDVDLVEEPEEEEPADGADADGASSEADSSAPEEDNADTEEPAGSSDVDTAEEPVEEEELPGDVSDVEEIAVDGDVVALASSTVTNLTSTDQHIQKTIVKNATVESNYRYKTSSSYIKVYLRADSSASVKVYLHDVTDNKNLTGQKNLLSTDQLTEYAFSNLSTGHQYRIVYKNNKDSKITIKGLALG